MNQYSAVNVGLGNNIDEALLVPTYNSELEPFWSMSYSAGECAYHENSMGSTWQAGCEYMAGTNGSMPAGGVFVSFELLNSVPEPGALALVLLGVLGAGAAKTNRKRTCPQS